VVHSNIQAMNARSAEEKKKPFNKKHIGRYQEEQSSQKQA